MKKNRKKKDPSMPEVQWREGRPDKAGGWWLWPDKGVRFFPRRPRVYLVLPLNDESGRPVLFIAGFRDRRRVVEVSDFKGKIFGPIESFAR